MGRLVITLLGPLQFRTDAGPIAPLPKKSAALLAYLARRPGQPHEREKLATLLWTEAGEASAREGLRHALLALRRALPPDAIVASGATLALATMAAAVDLAAFEAALDADTPASLETALSLYGGEFLDGFELREPEFAGWLRYERAQISRRAVDAGRRLLARRDDAGEPEQAIAAADLLLTLDATQEDVHRSLMRLYLRLGRRAAALRQYQACVAALSHELDIDPEPETRKLYEEMLRPAGPRDVPRPRHRSAAPAMAPVGSAMPASGPPIVGRAATLERLRAAIDAAERGRGRVVAIEGEAGIGKSRLVAETAAEISRRGGRVMTGYAYESEQILPFAVWADAIRRSGVTDDGDMIGALPPAWGAELARLFPELAIPGTSLPPADDPRRLFEALEQLFRRLAERPLVVLLEDLHWADEMSIRLLSFLARRLEGVPIAFLVTARPEELPDTLALDRALAELERAGCVERVPLAPLSSADTADLVRSLARAGRDAPNLAGIHRHIWALSEGNPFVVVETMRALEEGGLPGSADAPRLPARVREIIAGRLGRLGVPARRLAEIAAVIGRDADFTLLARAAGIGYGEAAASLEELVRRRVLHLVGERFDFTHDRLRRVAYDGILLPRQRILHRQVADAIGAHHAGDLGAHHTALAQHYRHAEIWDKAVAHFAAAAAQAAARSSHVDAAACYETALALLERLPRGPDITALAIDLRLDLHNVSIPIAGFERLLARLHEAEALAEAAGDGRRQARVECSLAEFLWTAGHHAEAVDSGNRAVAAAAGELAIEAQAKFFLGAAQYSLGDYRAGAEALGWIATALDDGHAREFFGRWFLLSSGSRHFQSWCLCELGDFDLAVARALECRAFDQGVANGFCAVNHLIAPGVAFTRRGQLDQGIPYLERALATARSLQVNVVLPWIASHLGYAYALRGRLDDGLALLEEAVTVAADMRLVTNAARWHVLLGEGYLLAGRLDEAQAAATRGLEMSRAQGERGDEGWALRLQGDIASARGDASAEILDAAAGRAAALGMRPLRARCHLSRGLHAAATGDAARARAELAAAAALFTDMQMVFWQERADAALTEA